MAEPKQLWIIFDVKLKPTVSIKRVFSSQRSLMIKHVLFFLLVSKLSANRTFILSARNTLPSRPPRLIWLLIGQASEKQHKDEGTVL